jgi:hypothetical protein
MDDHFHAVNSERVKHEITELRRLVTVAEYLFCADSDKEKLCERARTLRTVIHSTPDPRVVIHGFNELTKLVTDAMKQYPVDALVSIQSELDTFKRNSPIFNLFDAGHQIISPGVYGARGPELDHSPDLSTNHEAERLLAALASDWQIGPDFMLINTKSVRLSRLQQMGLMLVRAAVKPRALLRTVLSESVYRYVCSCNQKLVGMSFSIAPTEENIRAFDVLRCACVKAIACRSEWVPPLILCLTVAAHELRRGSSTGFHGVERLRAKLIVGHLIGELSQWDINAALCLADSTIESVSFSRSQILYQHENSERNLRKLVRRWYESDHPGCLDVTCQTLIFLGKRKDARNELERAKSFLLSPNPNAGSTYHQEYHERIVADVYLGRLARTLSLIDIEEGMKWSTEVASPALSLGCQLSCLIQGEVTSKSTLDRLIASVKDFARRNGLLMQNVAVAAFEMVHFPSARRYPEFPAERWDDIMNQQPLICDEDSQFPLERK